MVLLNLFHNQGRGRPIGGGQSYAQKVLGYSPIAYWPLWETVGGVAYDISGNGFHGAYTGVTLGQPGIGDGRTCPLFDGTNDHVNIYSAGLASAFNGAEFTIIGWQKVSSVGVWTDGTSDFALGLRPSGNDFIEIRKAGGNNMFAFRYRAGAVTESVDITSFNPTDWFYTALTVSKIADQVKAYLNGVQTGATQTALGVWGGTFSETQSHIGAQTATPTSPWNGWLGHWVIFDGALSVTTIADLAVL